MTKHGYHESRCAEKIAAVLKGLNMRKTLLLSLIVLLGVIPVSKAQEYELPPCIIDNSVTAHNKILPPYRDLMFSF